MDEGFLLLVVQCSTQMTKLVQKSDLLNGKQCLHMTNISSLLVEGIQNVVNNFHSKIKLGSSMEDLYRVMKRIEVIIQDCGRVDWVHASLWQMDNEEEFREVLEELKCNFDTMCGQFQSTGINIHGLQDSIDFTPINVLEVEKDRNALKSRLLAHIGATNDSPEYQKIVKHVYNRLVCRTDGEGLELNAVNFPTLDWTPQWSTLLGKGTFGQVYMTKCFGLDFAMKVFGKVDEGSITIANANFRKEVGILAGLSHPNIIKFICCGENLDNQDFGNYIVMEKMDKNLADHMHNKNLRRSYLVTIDIILQIARGMLYLHDMNVAHRDLKPENILVNFLDDPKLDGMGYVKVKLADFGIAKIEAKDVYEEPTWGKLGTIGYRAPETFIKHGERNRHVNAFKSDVFSFAMLCSYILTTTTPFSENNKSKSLKERMHDGEQPKLPLDCPKPLASLIEECWCLQPLERPTFEHICVRLCKVKGELLEDTQKISDGWMNVNTSDKDGFYFPRMKVTRDKAQSNDVEKLVGMDERKLR